MSQDPFNTSVKGSSDQVQCRGTNIVYKQVSHFSLRTRPVQFIQENIFMGISVVSERYKTIVVMAEQRLAIY